MWRNNRQNNIKSQNTQNGKKNIKYEAQIHCKQNYTFTVSICVITTAHYKWLSLLFMRHTFQNSAAALSILTVLFCGLLVPFQQIPE